MTTPQVTGFQFYIDTETLAGDGNAGNPLRAHSVAGAPQSFAAWKTGGGVDVALPASSTTDVMAMDIPAGLLTADKAGMLNATCAVAWDNIDVAIQASVRFALAWDDGVNPRTVIGVGDITVNPDMPDAGRNVGPAFYNIDIQGRIGGLLVAGGAGRIVLQASTNGATATYRVPGNGEAESSMAQIQLTVVPAANVVLVG